MIPAGQVTYPEMLCSVNLRFKVDGYPDYAQATGRGETPEQATANLTATIAATTAALAPQPATPRTPVQIIAGLVTCGMEKAVSRGDMGRVERLAKAAALVLGGRIETTEHDEVYRVHSLTSDQHYLVVANALTCTCPDARRQSTDEKPWLCKHVIAALMAQRIAKECPPAPAEQETWETVADPGQYEGSYGNGRTLVNGK